MKEPKIIFVDMDNVLVDFNQAFIETFKSIYGKELKYDAKSYDLLYQLDVSQSEREEIYLDVMTSKDFFYNVKPYDNAIEVLYELNDLYEVYICSKPYSKKGMDSAKDKLLWVNDYLPFIDPMKQVIFMSEKGLLSRKGRAIIEDSIDNLKAWKKGITVCYHQPYNLDYQDADFAVDNWIGIRELFLSGNYF